MKTCPVTTKECEMTSCAGAVCVLLQEALHPPRPYHVCAKTADLTRRPMRTMIDSEIAEATRLTDANAFEAAFLRGMEAAAEVLDNFGRYESALIVREDLACRKNSVPQMPEARAKLEGKA